MSLALFPRRFSTPWRANAVRGPKPAPHSFRMLDLVLLLDEPCAPLSFDDRPAFAGGRIVAEGIGRAGARVLKVTRLVDGSGVWVKPHRLRHLNGPRLLLIDGGKGETPCPLLRRA